MCATCGCDSDKHRFLGHRGPVRRIAVEEAVLAGNDRVAAENRAWLAARGIVALNLVSSPGAGKTTLLERTIRDLARDRPRDGVPDGASDGARDDGGGSPISVIEGDQETARDAERIRAAGAAAHQVNTGTGCHLDAGMIAAALRALAPAPRSLLFIENVGNLVCPALFDLGERAKVLVASVTEGEDKPIKYPHMFRAARLVLLSKIDLVEATGFDVDAFHRWLGEVNPTATVLPVSARRGDGMDAWYRWIDAEARLTVAAAPVAAAAVAQVAPGAAP